MYIREIKSERQAETVCLIFDTSESVERCNIFIAVYVYIYTRARKNRRHSLWCRLVINTRTQYLGERWNIYVSA